MPDLQLADGVGTWCQINRVFASAPALFLDRDGVVVEDVDYLDRPERVRMIAGAAAAIAACNAAAIPVVMVTNQSGIGRGYYGWRDFAAVQDAIAAILVAQDAHLDGVFACAYHAGGRPPYDVADHPWRKPRPGMILEAAQRMNLDLARSWIIGDKADDVAAGRAAGLAGATLVATGYGAQERDKALALAAAAYSVNAANSVAEAVDSLLHVLARRSGDTQR